MIKPEPIKDVHVQPPISANNEIDTAISVTKAHIEAQTNRSLNLIFDAAESDYLSRRSIQEVNGQKIFADFAMNSAYDAIVHLPDKMSDTTLQILATAQVQLLEASNYMNTLEMRNITVLN